MQLYGLRGCYSLCDKKETFEAMIYSNGIDGSFLSALFHTANVSEATLIPPGPREKACDEMFLFNFIIDQFEGKAGESVTPKQGTAAASAIALEGSALTRAVATHSALEQKEASPSAFFRVDHDGCIERD